MQNRRILERAKKNGANQAKHTSAIAKHKGIKKRVQKKNSGNSINKRLREGRKYACFLITSLGY
jgi:hypothetical protein